MTGKGLTWTAAHLRAAQSPEDVKTAIAEAAGQLGEAAIPPATVLAMLEELAHDAAGLRADLRNATRTREVLLASVAHDLRNPLNTFAMSAGLLRDDLEGAHFDPARALSLVTRMDRASARMQSLIEDLLDASRIESGTIELSKRAEQAAGIVQGVMTKAAPLAKEKGSTVEGGVAPPDAAIEVDKARTIDALTKLVVVLLKSTGEGGVIRVAAERTESDVIFTVRSAAPRGGKAGGPEERSSLAFLVGHGLIVAQGGQLSVETSEGTRSMSARFRAIT